MEEQAELYKEEKENIVPETKDFLDMSDIKKELDDGCFRDKDGYVPPIATEIKPGKPVSPIYCLTFPLGTPTEELLKAQPPEEIREAWNELQKTWFKDQYGENRELSRVRENHPLLQKSRPSKLSRQEKRAAARRNSKLKVVTVTNGIQI